MDAKGYVTQMLGLSHTRLREAIDGVSDADARRVMAGKLTPVVWQVGHLALVDGNYVRRAGGESPVPARYAELFKQGSGGEQDYPPLSEVWSVFDTTHRVLMDRASGADYEAPIDAPAYKTVGEMLLYSSYHRGYHIGKIMSLRGLLGKAPLR
ncbi:MAG TPA: DinB family protein [bacterium]|nr:DinB family protein [bacterium]